MAGLVCHLIDANADTAYFRSIAERCDRTRYPAMIGSLAPAGPLQQAMNRLGAPSYALGAGSRAAYPLAIDRLRRLLQRERAAVLHAHCFEPTLVSWIAARLAGVPFVFTRHHSDHHVRMGKRWHTRIDGLCARHADAVIAVSEATRRVLTGVEGVPDARIHVVYNGLEPLASPSRDALTRVRHALGLGEERVLLVAGRLHEEKGHRVLFDALSSIRSRIEPFVLLVAGRGPHRAAIESEAAARGLGESVRFLGQRDDIGALMSIAALTIVPSLAESFGYVVLEAMSLGRPIVATTTGGIPEVVGDSGAARLVEPGSSTSLADAIAAVLLDPPAAAAMAEAGRRRAERFGFETMMRGYEAVYDRVLRERRHG